MKLKQLISALLLVTVLFSSFLCVSAAEQHRVTDDFESYSSKVNETINGVTKWAGARPIVTENGNKSAIIGAGNGDTFYAATSGFSSDVTGVIARFSVKINNKKDCISGLAVCQSSGNWWTGSLRLIQFNDTANGGKIYVGGSNKYPIDFNYSLGVWYDVEIQVNYNTGYYKLTISDRTTSKTFTLPTTNLTRTAEQKLKNVRYQFFTSSNTLTGTMQIDNVDIFGTTDNRIYPESIVNESFSSFVSPDGTTVPDGFTQNGATGSDNGFVSLDGKLNLVSKSDASLSLTKTADNELSPGNVKLKLSSAASPEFKIKLTDTAGSETVIDISSDGLSGGGKNANLNIDAGTISLSVKDGKVYASFNNGTDFAALDFAATLTGIKTFSVVSDEGEVTDIMLSQIDYGTVKYFEEASNSISDAKVLPNTNKITLDFSNKLMPSQSGAFAITGDRTIDSVVISDGTAIITLDDKLSPDCDYALSYTDLYDIDSVPLLDTIEFKTDIALRVENFDIEASSDAYNLAINLNSNTGENQNLIVLLTVYDNATGKIISMDFEKITAAATQAPLSVSVSKPSNGSYSVEAYIWDGLNTMNSLGYTDILLGGVSE